MISQYLALWSFTLVIAAPDVAFPFNSQVPPVARVGQPYLFTFSPTTFRPNGEAFQYALTGAPAWLNLDSASRTISGIPQSTDVGSPTFIISAFDGTGKGSMQATLVVVTYEPPQIGVGISDALGKAGKLCGPSRITFPPRTPFTLDFPSNMFTETGRQLLHYSTLSDHTPLPGWLTFDPRSLTFAGITPTLSASPQQFEILIIASDVAGFAGAWVSFTVVVSDHQFYFDQVNRSMTIGPGSAVNINDLRTHLLLDGVPVSDGDLAAATAYTPPWITFSQGSLGLAGIPPSGMEIQDINLGAQDRFGDIANMTVHLRVISGLFVSEIGTLNATVGKEFNYTIDKSAFTRSDVQISVDLGSASSWLHYDSSLMTLSGKVPLNLLAQSISGGISVKTSDGSQKDFQPFIIRVVAAEKPTSTVSTRTLNSSAAPPTGGVAPGKGEPGTTKTNKALGRIVGIVIALVFVIFGIVVAVLWCRKPHKRLDRSRSARMRKISRPLAADKDPWTTEIHHEYGDLERGSGGFERTPDHPPKIVLDLSSSPQKTVHRPSQLGFATVSPVKVDRALKIPRHNYSTSVASTTINDGDALILDNINRSSWGYSGASTHTPHDSMRIATQIARASRQLDSDSPTSHRRPSRHLSGNRMSSGLTQRNSAIRIMNGGLPMNPRLTGLGHGRSSSGPTRNSMLGIVQMQQQYRSPSCTESYSTHSTSIMSSHALLHSSVRLSRQSSQLGSQRRSVRNGVVLDPRRVSMQRPLSRRGHRSTFFSGGPSSRGSSSSRHRNTVLGLSTIHGSPDLGTESPAAESSDALGTVTSNVTGTKGDSSNSTPPTPPLHHGSTQTNSKAPKAWQTAAVTTSNTALRSDTSGHVQPQIHPQSAAQAHKRWSSNLLRTRPSRPSSTLLIPGAQNNASETRESVLFASAVETDSSSVDEGDADGNTLRSGSVYSQSSLAVATPSRPPIEGKIPTGGIRVPPFTSTASESEPSIMSRPHPRASFRNANVGTSVIRAPLRNVRGGENRNSGSGFSSGGDGLGFLGKQSKGDKVERPRLRSARSNKPVSVESVESVGGSLRGRFNRVRSSERGDQAFL
jgi:hypothetical protein